MKVLLYFLPSLIYFPFSKINSSLSERVDAISELSDNGLWISRPESFTFYDWDSWSCESEGSSEAIRILFLDWDHICMESGFNPKFWFCSSMVEFLCSSYVLCSLTISLRENPKILLTTSSSLLEDISRDYFCLISLIFLKFWGNCFSASKRPILPSYYNFLFLTS